MSFAFKIWDQANDGQTMAIRAANVSVLQRLSVECTGPDAAGNWENLADYLNHARVATAEPIPYVRNVDLLWASPAIALPNRYSQDRRFRVTYSGRLRGRGGFASQGYCIVDPAWNGALQPHHRQPITVEWYRGDARDLIVVS